MLRWLWSTWSKRRTAAKLYPECLWSVRLSGESIEITDGSGNKSLVSLGKLQAVVIETGDGPFGTDWWLLDGADGLLASFPLGAEGEDEAVGMFQQLPGFDPEKMNLAMHSTAHSTFVVWKRKRR